MVRARDQAQLEVERGAFGLRLTSEEEYEGADLAIHKIGATPDREVNW